MRQVNQALALAEHRQLAVIREAARTDWQRRGGFWPDDSRNAGDEGGPSKTVRRTGIA